MQAREATAQLVLAVVGMSLGRYSAPVNSRPKSQYVCSACGGASPKWLGKCPHCNEWNTLDETVAEPSGTARHRYQSLAKTQAVATLSEIETADIERTPTGQPELDRRHIGYVFGPV